MRVGIISDTHGQVDFTRPAVRMLESLDVERLFHCGDIGSPEVVELLRAGRPTTCSAIATWSSGCCARKLSARVTSATASLRT